MKGAIHAVLCALPLAGCATMQPAGEPVPLDQLVRQIKSDIAEYNADPRNHAAPRLNACHGQVDFTIKSVKVTVVTTTKRTTTGSFGAEVSPYAFLDVKANAGLSRARTNSQTLTFVLVPVAVAPATKSPAAAVETVESVPESQLVTALADLRTSLLAASDKTPCLTFPPEKDQDNSVEFGFTATNGENGGAVVNLFLFAIGGSRSTERTAANTIKIVFFGNGEALN